MPSKFSLFAQSTKELEAKARNSANTVAQNCDAIPAKDKNPDDLEIKQLLYYYQKIHQKGLTQGVNPF